MSRNDIVKTIALLFATTLSIASYSQNTCNLLQVINGATGSTIAYIYDNNNHVTGLTMTGGGVTANYAVTTNEQGYATAMAIQGMAATGWVLNKASLTYDINHNLIKEEVYLGTSAVPTITEIRKYNSAGQMVHMKQISSWATPEGKVNTGYNYNIFTYPNATTKNPSKITIHSGTDTEMKPEPDQITEFTYDDKKTADSHSANDYEAFAINNVISAAITYVNSNVNENRVSTFEYNAQGYPTSRTYKANGGKTCVDTYSYNCK